MLNILNILAEIKSLSNKAFWKAQCKESKKITRYHFQRPIQNPVKHLRWSVLLKYFMAFSRYIFPKLSILDFGLGAEYAPDFIDIFPISTF